MTIRTTIRNAETFIRDAVPFNAGNFWAEDRAVMISLGHLPRHLDRFWHAERRNVDYVVYSYATPIAWRLKSGEWKYPEVTYSMTTTRHQHVTRMALRHANVTQPGGLKLDGR